MDAEAGRGCWASWSAAAVRTAVRAAAASSVVASAASSARCCCSSAWVGVGSTITCLGVPLLVSCGSSSCHGSASSAAVSTLRGSARCCSPACAATSTCGGARDSGPQPTGEGGAPLSPPVCVRCADSSASGATCARLRPWSRLSCPRAAALRRCWRCWSVSGVVLENARQGRTIPRDG